MNELKADIRKAKTNELKRIIEQHGLFHSNNEGFGVILEESVETIDEAILLEKYIVLLFSAVKDNDGEMIESLLGNIIECATNLASESSQVAAVAEKWLCGGTDDVRRD